MPSQTHEPHPLCDPIDYPAPKKYVLVLSCVDARLLDELNRFLHHDNLTNRYYHVTLAGTSLGLTRLWERDVADPLNPPAHFAEWRTTFIDQVQAAVLLTKGQITDIYIIQHADCGAFREYIKKDSADMTESEEQHIHNDYANALLQDIANNFCTVYNPTQGPHHVAVQEKKPSIHTFFMDLRGNVSHLDSWIPPKGEAGICCEYKCYCPEPEKRDEVKAEEDVAPKPKRKPRK